MQRTHARSITRDCKKKKKNTSRILNFKLSKSSEEFRKFHKEQFIKSPFYHEGKLLSSSNADYYIDGYFKRFINKISNSPCRIDIFIYRDDDEVSLRSRFHFKRLLRSTLKQMYGHVVIDTQRLLKSGHETSTLHVNTTQG